jgi:chromosome segregation protein
VLGATADAVAVAGLDDAMAALRRLHEQDAGRAGLLISSGGQGTGSHGPPPRGEWLADAVTASTTLAGPVARALADVVLVGDLDEARAVVDLDPSLRAVTLTGDIVGRDWVVGGSKAAPSTLEVQAAHDEADQKFTEAVHRGERLRFALATAREDQTQARAAVDRSLEALNDNDARIAAFQERLALLGAQARSAHGEAERLQRSRREAEEARETALSALAALEERLAMAEAAGEVEERTPQERDRLAAALEEVRAEEVEARLAVRTGEERARGLAGRAEGMTRRAAAERSDRERRLAAAAARERGAVVARSVAEVAGQALTGLAVARQRAAEARDEAESARTVREGELLEVRARARTAGGELDALRDALHRDEVARTEQRMRVEQLETRAVEEWQVPLDELVGQYGPDQLIPPEPDPDNPDAELAEPQPFDRAAQERRAAQADRKMALLGKVNPLALEEFEALQERHAFLATQLEDLRTTRRDLMGIVKDVDERILEVFREAFTDTAREFEKVFATLFPGGEGRLVLTEPDDLLVTGIEVEARPPGKKVKRLSLLSGGERSLTAIALLLAIFRARPSPFYVLDEVEAALDDVNLGRLLEALEGLRESSQLIIITHQQRTMETADALYGVTMRGDGVTQVISQRLREPEAAGV